MNTLNNTDLYSSVLLDLLNTRKIDFSDKSFFKSFTYPNDNPTNYIKNCLDDLSNLTKDCNDLSTIIHLFKMNSDSVCLNEYNPFVLSYLYKNWKHTFASICKQSYSLTNTFLMLGYTDKDIDSRIIKSNNLVSDNKELFDIISDIELLEMNNFVTIEDFIKAYDLEEDLCSKFYSPNNNLNLENLRKNCHSHLLNELMVTNKNVVNKLEILFDLLLPIYSNNLK